MRSESYHGVVQQGVVVLHDAPEIPDGTPVVVTRATHQRGTSSAVLDALAAPPHLSPDTVDELDRAMEAGTRPLPSLDPFGSRT